MSSDQMPAPGKIKLIKFPPSGQEKTSNARGMPREGDVEASIWLIHYLLMRKQCLMFMLLLAASTVVTQGVITWGENNASYLLLLAASTAAYFVPHEQQIGCHLYKDLSLDEKPMPFVYVIFSRTWAHWEKSIENKISKRCCWVVQTYCLDRAQWKKKNLSYTHITLLLSQFSFLWFSIQFERRCSPPRHAFPSSRLVFPRGIRNFFSDHLLG